MLPENDRQVITRKVIHDFLEDCAGIGVKGIPLVSDGESTISPVFVDTIRRGTGWGCRWPAVPTASCRTSASWRRSSRT